ncbi:hypothetical protein VF21_05386 [Pseudogymnoascus sp. 05NY08]|nr:hypothetical protein VF21_05386 [Pseudogymnoascus sp. 05NY08]
MKKSCKHKLYMASMSPADRYDAKRRVKQIQDAIHLRGTAPYSRVVMMTQEELRTLMLDLGDQRPTREPGNTMCKEIMNLHGEKFHIYCKYSELWDTIGQQWEATDAAQERLRNHKGATVEELEAAIDVLQTYLDASLEIIKCCCTLLCMLNDNEALSLRQLVAAQGEATTHRQDRIYYDILASRMTVLCRKVRTKMAKPFKVCAATAKKVCRKIRKAKKKKGKKVAGAIVV